MQLNGKSEQSIINKRGMQDSPEASAVLVQVSRLQSPLIIVETFSGKRERRHSGEIR